MPITYSQIPTASKFQGDSSVLGATRSRDVLLTSMDKILQRLPAVSDRDSRFTMVADLFFIINNWVIALRAKNPAVDPKRYDAVMALLGAVEADLMRTLVTSNRGTLAHQIKEIFGAKITSHGLSTDMQFGAKSFNSAEREVARIRIQGGLMMRSRADLPSGGGIMALNSRDFHNGAFGRKGAGGAMQDFGAFVMSMEREFYMSYHFVGQNGVFHSAYFGGAPVLAAGTMLVENGVLKAIRGDSGHYMPSPQQMAQCLRALQSQGVNLSQVLFYSYAAFAVPNSATREMNEGHNFAPQRAPARLPTIQASNRPPVPSAVGRAPLGQPGLRRPLPVPGARVAPPVRSGRPLPVPGSHAARGAVPPPRPPRHDLAQQSGDGLYNTDEAPITAQQFLQRV